MPMNDVLNEELPEIPVQYVDDKKLKDKHKKTAADLSAFQAKVSAIAKGLEKDVKALERSFDELVKAFMDAKEAKHGKDADKVGNAFAAKVGRVQRLVKDFDLGL